MLGNTALNLLTVKERKRTSIKKDKYINYFCISEVLPRNKRYVQCGISKSREPVLVVSTTLLQIRYLEGSTLPKRNFFAYTHRTYRFIHVPGSLVSPGFPFQSILRKNDAYLFDFGVTMSLVSDVYFLSARPPLKSSTVSLVTVSRRGSPPRLPLLKVL